MARLSRSDLEAVLAFAGEAGVAAAERGRADVWLLERIARLIDTDIAAYDLMDSASRLLFSTEFPGPYQPPDEHVWELLMTQNPFCDFRKRTGEPYFAAVRQSDIVDDDAYSATEFAEVFAELPYTIQMRMPAESGAHWVLEVDRARRDFSDRDVLLIDALRPSLMAYEAHRTLVATVEKLQAVRRDAVPDGILSTRENEVLDLVAEGASNSEIAQRLWISPGTVKKHLENVYVKLDVGSRMAAVAQTGRSLVASDARGQGPGSN